MERLGGTGHAEEGPLPTLSRQAPLNGVCDGSGGVVALDIRRTLRREAAALRAELEVARGADRRLDAALAAFDPRPPEAVEARRFAAHAAALLQAATLVRAGPPAVVEAFCATSLGGGGGLPGEPLAPGAAEAALRARGAARAPPEAARTRRWASPPA